MHESVARAAQIVSLLDLTSLTGAESGSDIDGLCARAESPLGPVAAICVHRQHLPRVRAGLERLGLTTVGLATVVNFPGGGLDEARVVAEIREALALGATEVDLVFPYREFMSGQTERVRCLLDASRKACHPMTAAA